MLNQSRYAMLKKCSGQDLLMDFCTRLTLVLVDKAGTMLPLSHSGYASYNAIKTLCKNNKTQINTSNQM